MNKEIRERKQQRPIRTARCTSNFMQRLMARFIHHYASKGEMLRFEVETNNQSARLVLVFDWIDPSNAVKKEHWFKEN